MTETLPPVQSPSPLNERNYEVGYARPPKTTRFKPGQSGNPKGRPKGSRNLHARLKEIYLGNVVINDGQCKRSVTRLEALFLKQWERAIKGSDRAAQGVVAIAKMLGVFEDAQRIDDSSVDGLTKEEIALLSDEALDALIKIETRRTQRAKKWH